MNNLILAIDQGTTGTTCLVVALQKQGGLEVLGRGYSELPQHFPKPGWVEHDLNQIWQSVELATALALKAANKQGKDVRAIGITNQRETTGLWNRHGNPVHNAIVWQDRRTTQACKSLREQGHEDLFRARTGLVLDPYFAGTKLAWLLDNVEGTRAQAQRGELCFGTMDTWLVYKLTGGQVHKTDATNASRTLFYDIVKGAWDTELMGLLGNLPQGVLPEVCDSSEVFGTTQGLGFLPDGIAISGIAGDQQAALFGQACFVPGMAKCTYGTGAFALVNTGDRFVPSKHGLVSTIAWRLGNKTTYALEGSTFIAGAVVQWLRDGLGFFKSSAEIEGLAREVPDSQGVMVVPALTGLGAPHWRPEARGIITGLTRGTTRAHIARAALEGIALQVFDLLEAMQKDSGAALKVLRVDGGASANDLLMQFQADLLGITLHRPTNLETTAFGAASLAALGVGMFKDLDEVSRAWQLQRDFAPKMQPAEVQERVAQWREAVAKA